MNCITEASSFLTQLIRPIRVQRISFWNLQYQHYKKTMTNKTLAVVTCDFDMYDSQRSNN